MSSVFSSRIADLDLWQLNHEVVVSLDGPRFVAFRIPQGYVWDKATVPLIARWLIGKEDLNDIATLVHDLIYEYDGRVPASFLDQDFKEMRGLSVLEITRREADDIFLCLMLEMGVSTWKAALAYYAVRAFGWIKWTRSFKDKIKKDAKRTFLRIVQSEGEFDVNVD